MGGLMRQLFVVSLVAFTALGRAAETPPPSPSGAGVTDASAVLAPTQGQQARGTVRFHQEKDGLRITGEVTGLTANAKQGFHIHEFGDCSAADGASAGGHFAPEGHPHGAPDPAQHHAGDLGNVEADANGKAKVDVTVPGLTLATGDRAIIGRALIVHAQPDDLTSQPTGNAGPRAGCAVIRAAKPGG